MKVVRRQRMRQKARGRAHFAKYPFVPMGMFTHIATIGNEKLMAIVANGEVGRYENTRFIDTNKERA